MNEQSFILLREMSKVKNVFQDQQNPSVSENSEHECPEVEIAIGWQLELDDVQDHRPGDECEQNRLDMRRKLEETREKATDENAAAQK